MIIIVKRFIRNNYTFMIKYIIDNKLNYILFYTLPLYYEYKTINNI